MFELEHDHGMNPDRMERMLPWEFEVNRSLLMENLKRKSEAQAKR